MTYFYFLGNTTFNCLEVLRPEDISCEGLNDEFRTINGICNNEKNPTFGAAEIPLERLLRMLFIITVSIGSAIYVEKSLL